MSEIRNRVLFEKNRYDVGTTGDSLEEIRAEHQRAEACEKQKRKKVEDNAIRASSLR